MPEKKETQLPLSGDAPTAPTQTGNALTVKTEALKAFLQFSQAIRDEHFLIIDSKGFSVHTRDSSNTCMGIVEMAVPNSYPSEVKCGVRLANLVASLPKSADMKITPDGRNLKLEAPDYEANFVMIADSDPSLVQSELKRDKDFRTVQQSGFIVGAKDFADKTQSLKSAFAKVDFLTMISEEKKPEEVILTIDDSALGSLHYRLLTSGGKPETWRRGYSFDLIMPMLKTASSYTQEIKIGWLINPKNGEAVTVLSGQTADGLIRYAYAIAPRIPPESIKD
jgi:hypothetical protein